jgi:hypothetical protein
MVTVMAYDVLLIGRLDLSSTRDSTGPSCKGAHCVVAVSLPRRITTLSVERGSGPSKAEDQVRLIVRCLFHVYLLMCTLKFSRPMVPTGAGDGSAGQAPV